MILQVRLRVVPPIKQKCAFCFDRPNIPKSSIDALANMKQNGEKNTKKKRSYFALSGQDKHSPVKLNVPAAS